MKLIEKITTAIRGARGSVDEIRAEIAGVQAEIAEIETAPIPLDAALARFEDTMNRRAEEADESVRYRMSAFAARDGRDAGGFHLVSGENDVESIVWGLLREELIDAARKSLAAHYTGLPLPRTDAEQAIALAPLTKKLHDLEIAEETAILEAERAGMQIERRADMSPEIFLEIA